MFIIVTQLLVAYLIEVFGLFGAQKAGFDWSKVVGMLLLIAGVLVFKWK